MEEQTNGVETVEAELVKDAVDLRRPAVPVTITDLAEREDEGVAIIEARNTIIRTLRKASIAVTSPTDWILFKSKDASVTGYLQDCGADRVRALWGIEVHPAPSIAPMWGFERTEAEDGSFAYTIRGSGVSRVTGETVSDLEGTRLSTEDFVKLDTGIAREVKVKKAARANLDGGIVRELTGLRSVPIQELEDAWQGSWKKTTMCIRGRGFGSGAERAGAQTQEAPHVQPGAGPVCGICGAKAKFWPAGTGKTTGKPYSAFWSCPGEREQHPDKKWSIQDKDWQAQAQKPREAGEEG